MERYKEFPALAFGTVSEWRAWLEAQGVAMSARPKSGSH